jgi:hypothetical protein
MGEKHLTVVDPAACGATEGAIISHLVVKGSESIEIRSMYG